MIFKLWGYTAWKYDPESILQRLDRVTKTLQYMKNKRIHWDALAVMGTSGIWLAPLLTLRNHKMVLIRKKDEKSHGARIEGPSNEEITRLVFIDDLICTGETIRNAQEQLNMYCKEHDNEHPMKIIAVVLHDTQMEDYDRKERGIPIYGYIEE